MPIDAALIRLSPLAELIADHNGLWSHARVVGDFGQVPAISVFSLMCCCLHSNVTDNIHLPCFTSLIEWFVSCTNPPYVQRHLPVIRIVDHQSIISQTFHVDTPSLYNPVTDELIEYDVGALFVVSKAGILSQIDKVALCGKLSGNPSQDNLLINDARHVTNKLCDYFYSTIGTITHQKV